MIRVCSQHTAQYNVEDAKNEICHNPLFVVI